MAKLSRRTLIQSLGFLFLNGKLENFFTGKIHTGASKNMCVPVLNCYSCPGAIGSCPIGSLQGVSGSNKFNISFYVVGLLVLFGIVGGRLYCGYLCPFGFIQDLLYKFKTKRISHLKIPKILSYIKYLVLLVFVLILPSLFSNSLGITDPYFCKYICPSGTMLAGIPLILTNPGLSASIGALFFWKLGLAIFILVLSVFLFRPFCKFLCPLGAIYALFNKISFYKLRINHKCISCGKCQKACDYDIYTKETPNSPECIRCDKCIESCPTGAIERTFLDKKI